MSCIVCRDLSLDKGIDVIKNRTTRGKMPIEMFTIGYEGREVDEFVSRLKQFKVTRLIDVREIPLSRKKGFSKSALKEKLEDENIEYVHIKSLGSPSNIRKKLKADWDYDYFFKSYSKHLQNNFYAVKEAYDYVRSGINCVMCFERLPDKCHRSIAAIAIREYDNNGLKIKHI